MQRFHCEEICSRLSHPRHLIRLKAITAVTPHLPPTSLPSPSQLRASHPDGSFPKLSCNLHSPPEAAMEIIMYHSWCLWMTSGVGLPLAGWGGGGRRGGGQGNVKRRSTCPVGATVT